MSSGSWGAAVGVPGSGGVSKLLVHVAEDGRSFAFDCDGSTLVGAVQCRVHEKTGVPPNDQLLLCGITALAVAEKPLSAYRLPSDGLDVFLYNKARLHENAPQPESVEIDIPEPEFPSPPVRCSPGEPADPALNALISYENQFRYHFKVAEVLHNHSRNKFDVSERLIREGQVQERAVDTARNNIHHTFQKFLSRYTDFIQRFSQQHRGHGELLVNFERDLERLKKVMLHPALQTESRRFLIDLVKEQELRELAVGSLSSHRQFEAKVSQWKSNFIELKRRVESVLAMMNSAIGRDHELVMKEYQKVIEEQKSIMQTLSKDVHKVKELVDGCSSPQASTSLRAHDAVSAVGSTNEIHEIKILPRMRDYDELTAKLLGSCIEKKNEMNFLVHVCMQKVRSVQIDIKRMISELHAFQEVMTHQDKLFDNLKLASGIGHAYKACLAEVVRRRSSYKLYMGLAGQMVEKLAIEREAEIGRRDGFFRAWSRYIPRDILGSMGLFDTPSHCDVNIAPFDGDLLEIDMKDIDYYAPPSLVSNFSIAAPKVTSACSGTSGDLQELPEASDTIDIAGTSKMEVENAMLKAELASAIAIICSLRAEIGYDSFQEGQSGDAMNVVHEKIAEALNLKDDYANQLQLMLQAKNKQCVSYEQRIQELEQRLPELYIKSDKDTAHKDISGSNTYKLELGDEQGHMPSYSSVTMDEVSSSTSVDLRHAKLSSDQLKHVEGGDENMADLLGASTMPLLGLVQNAVDSSMSEVERNSEEKAVTFEEGKEINVIENTKTKDPVCDPQLALELADKESLITELQHTLKETSEKLAENERRLGIATEEVNEMKRELEISRALLDESQMNCAHLENHLHQAREDARTNKCAAERRADEYETLRSSVVKIRSMFERLRSCVAAPTIPSFAESLQSLALSISSSAKNDEVESTSEIQYCVNALADRVGALVQQSSELLDLNTRLEATRSQLTRELDEKRETIKSLYTKHLASRDRISLGRLDVRELAAFVRNSAGDYEAISRSSSKYYLSEESVALFTDHHSRSPSYVIGQIVHIERRVVKSPALPPRVDLADQVEATIPESWGRRSSGPRSLPNQYNLPVGCEYFVVTIAMLPDSVH